MADAAAIAAASNIIDTAVMAGMQAQITHGMKKEDSQYVTDDATSKFWDDLAAEMANPPAYAQGKPFVYDVVRD